MNQSRPDYDEVQVKHAEQDYYLSTYMMGSPMKILTTAVAFVLTVFAMPVMAQPADTIGYVRELTGNAKIVRDGMTQPAAVGLALRRGDLIQTDKPGAVGIILIDDTTISLGSSSELALNAYDFSPEEGRFSLLMRMIKGTFVYVSGQLGKLAPNSIQLSIPDAVIAVRGTKLLVEIKE